MTTEVKEVKLCLLGESGVGKSSLVHRLVHDTFQPRLENTIGAAFFTKSMKLESTLYKFQIWDTAGQEKFRALAPMYYRGASVAIIVYDITVQSSFDAVLTWMQNLKQYADQDIVIAIAGNKCDLEDKRKVQFSDALEFAQSEKAIFVETSAKMAVNVETLFQEIGECLAKRLMSKETTTNRSVIPKSSNIVIPRSSDRRRTACNSCSKSKRNS